ncbi:MAG: molecular chaperone DnaJ [Myxococcota bacterium]
MSAKVDYYEALGVSRDADAREVKRAYRKMALKYHPDRNHGDTEAEERFKECSEAYQVLSDPDKRRIYDQFGHEGLSGSGYGGFTGGFEDIFSQFGDIFGDIFGGGGARRRARRGADMRYDLELDFEEAAFGTKKDLSFRRREICDTCEGSGAKPGTSPTTCSGCQGSGRVTRQQGFFMVQTTCPVCRGDGRIIESRCEGCGGQGMAAVERDVSVSIPPGVDDGVRMRVGGEGEPAPGGAARGDLYVFIHVRPHDVFQRDGADVYMDLDMSYTQAALGDEVTVPTLHGDETVKIPSGTQPGSVLRLRGKGIPRLRGRGKGDQFVTLNLQVPEKLSRSQKKLVKELRSEGL